MLAFVTTEHGIDDRRQNVITTNHINKALQNRIFVLFSEVFERSGGEKVKKATVLIAVLALLMLSSTAFAFADTATSTVPATGPSATGKGWYVFNGRRHNFAFAIQGGTLNETDGWRYAPKGYLSVAILDFKGNKLVQVKSVRVWRFRTEKIDGGSKVVIAGVANLQVAIGVLENWWFRAEARDVTVTEKGGDGFSISLWRTGGANNFGCWTARIFNPQKPGSLRLNPTPFYTAFGRLRGGTVEIMQ